MKNKIRIQNNTDGVDIREKCLGLDCWIEGDSVNSLNSKRGLHIQIRHNQDKTTFDVANQVAKLMTAAPDLLEALESMYAVYEVMLNNTQGRDDSIMFNARQTIAKAKGEEK